MPLPLMSMGIGALSGLASMFGANAQNQNAINQYVQGELQKGINNGKAIADAVYNEAQQARGNRAIRMGAWKWEQDQRDRVSLDAAFEYGVQQRAMAMAAAQTKSSLAHRNIRGGTSSALERQNLMNGFKQAKMLKQNTDRKYADILAEAERMHSQVNLSVFIPNLQGPSAAPVLQNAALAGLASGVSAGVSAFGTLKG